jgi:hypothetical protein
MARTALLAVVTACLWLGGAPITAAQEPTGAPAPETPPSPAPGVPTGPDAPVVVRDHRTIRSFPANLGHNMLEPWSRHSLLPLAVGSAATGLSVPFDDNVVRYFDSHPHENWGNIGKYVGTGVVAVGVSAAVLGFSRYANGDRFRAASYDMGQAVIVNFVYTLALKEAVRRPRPDGADNQSFPSGHASNAFACATVWAEQYGWKGGLIGYSAATFVAGSRLASKKHHLSDIVAGATLGYIVGKSVARWDAKPSSKPVPEKLKVTLGTATAPDGSGLGLRVDVVF